MARTRPKGLHNRRVLGFALAVLGCLAMAFGWLSRRKEKVHTFAEISARETSLSQAAAIVVGPNVQVSFANRAFLHREVQAATDPTDPRRMFVAAISYAHADTAIPAAIGYRTEDGGQTWQPSFRRERADETQADLAVAFGPDGELYVEFATGRAPGPPPGEFFHPTFRYFRSRDAGKTWEEAGVMEGTSLDRPYLAVDCSSGSYRGRLYCASMLQFHVSADQGQTFAGLRYAVPKHSVDPMPSNPVVLSDGTVVCAYRDWRQDLHALPGIGVMASEDGGRTLRELAWVPAWRGESCEVGKFWFLPQLAVDATSQGNRGSGAFRDRLYAVWDDGNGPLRVRILFAYSSDKGRTWVGPTVVSEQPADGSWGYGAHMPAVAVNKDGVVAVSWYDRRGLPDVRTDRVPYYGPGCNVRLRVSLDGGETWQPSVQVNEQEIRATAWDLRDNASLVADAAGVFHPCWSDDRTGVLQAWTARVDVTRP